MEYVGSQCVKTFVLEDWNETFNEAQNIENDGIMILKL